MGLGFLGQSKRTGAEPDTHHITEGFCAGRLTPSRVLSGVRAALYLSLIVKSSSEDVCPRRSQRTMGTGRRGGLGADESGLQELEGRRLGWAVCSGASWQVNAFVFAAPPSEAGFVSLLGWSLAGPRQEPQEWPVHCRCRSDAEGTKSLGLRMGPLGLALRSLPSCDS